MAAFYCHDVNTAAFDGWVPKPFAPVHFRFHRSFGRAMERLIASDRMTAFSKPPDGVASNGNGGEEGEEESVGIAIAGQNQSGRSTAGIVPEQEALVPAPCSPGSSEAGRGLHSACETSGELCVVGNGGTERCMESIAGEAAPVASVALPLHPNSCPLETELDEEHGARGDTDGGRSGNGGLSGGLAPLNEALVMTAGLGEEVAEAAEEDGIAAADWLEVTHALLEEVNESGQARR